MSNTEVKAKENKKPTYNDNDKLIVATLKATDRPMTLAEISEAAGVKFVAGNIVSAMRKQLVANADEVEVSRNGKRKVATYKFVSAEAFKNEDGKDYPYSDKEKAILAVASQLDGAFTLAALSEVMGAVLVSGNINALLRKGNIVKDEDVIVNVIVKAMVKTYVLGPKANELDA